MKLNAVPTDTFYRILADLHAEQWKIVSEYAGFDRGIDCDFVVLKRQGIKLKFVWVLYLDGSVEGPDSLVLELRERYSLL